MLSYRSRSNNTTVKDKIKLHQDVPVRQSCVLSTHVPVWYKARNGLLGRCWVPACQPRLAALHINTEVRCVGSCIMAAVCSCCTLCCCVRLIGLPLRIRVFLHELASLVLPTLLRAPTSWATFPATAACRHMAEDGTSCIRVQHLELLDIKSFGHHIHTHLNADLAPITMSFCICCVFLNQPSYSFGIVPLGPPKNMCTEPAELRSPALPIPCCRLA